METLNFNKVNKYSNPRYLIDVPLDSLKQKMKDWSNYYELDLDPEFQRDHVWTLKQQIEFMEYLLRGGYVNPIFFNMEGWMEDFRGKLQLIDGKQRFNTIMKFIDNKLPVFGGYTINQIENFNLRDFSIKYGVNNLSEKEAIDWYVSMNTGGTIHTDEEIQKAIEYKNKI